MDLSNVSIKCVIVGDGAVGKTCLLFVYAKGEFPKNYVPTVFDNYSTKVPVNDSEVELILWDTAGQEDYDKIRPLSYHGTNIFLMCFSVMNRSSFVNCKEKWHPELVHHLSDSLPPILLIGTKSDLRDDPKSLEEVKRKGDTVVSEAEGKSLAKQIGAVKYMECSAKANIGVKEVFDEVIKTHLFPPVKPVQKKKKECSLL